MGVVSIENEKINLISEDVELIILMSLVGKLLAGAITVALDITLSEKLIEEGLSRFRK